MKSFNPVGGSFNGHLFENPRTGVPLGIYWSFEVDFEPLVDDDGDEWPCNILIEWLSWPLQRWRQLDGCSLQTATPDVQPEVSVYAFSQHQTVSHATFDLKIRGPHGAHIQGAVVLDLEDLEGEVTSNLEITFSADLTFNGLIVVPGNLVRKPSGATEATAALAAFIDMSDFDAPEFDEWRWVFKPRASSVA